MKFMQTAQFYENMEILWLEIHAKLKIPMEKRKIY